MAVILHMTYSKKLGLPNYSSHSCSVSIQTEIADLNQATDECNRLYALLQTSVDKEIQDVGFLPDATKYGMIESKKTNGTGANNGNAQSANGNQNGVNNSNGNGNGVWRCSEKQQELISKIMDEHHLDPRDVEELAQERFGSELKALNKLQASGLISELLEKHSVNNRTVSRTKTYANGAGKGRR